MENYKHSLGYNRIQPILEDLEDPMVRNKILNPNQRQLFEDSRQFQAKVNRLREGRTQNLSISFKSFVNASFLSTENQGSPPQLYIRPKSVERDIGQLDIHDSFYNTTKSLQVLFQVMGVMPILRTKEGVKGARTTYSWTSPISCWAYLVFVCESIIVVWGEQHYLKVKDIRNFSVGSPQEPRSKYFLKKNRIDSDKLRPLRKSFEQTPIIFRKILKKYQEKAFRITFNKESL